MIDKKNWFWEVVFFNKKIYYQIFLASFFINVFAICSAFYVMTVYDKVIPNRGDKSVSGSPVTNQCATILAKIGTAISCGAINNCSSDPSSKSNAKILSIDSSVASSAMIHMIPGAISLSRCASGDKPNGTSVQTIEKKISGATVSPNRRYANSTSRLTYAEKLGVRANSVILRVNSVILRTTRC